MSLQKRLNNSQLVAACMQHWVEFSWLVGQLGSNIFFVGETRDSVMDNWYAGGPQRSLIVSVSLSSNLRWF